jgi:hypothetical protein
MQNNNGFIFLIFIAIISIVNLIKLIKSDMSIKYKLILLIFGSIYMINFGVLMYHSSKIGTHLVLTDGYIQNGEYFVAKSKHIGSAMQISEWDYNFNLLVGKCFIVTFIVSGTASLLVYLKTRKTNKTNEESLSGK